MRTLRPFLVTAIFWIAAVPALANDPARASEEHHDIAPPASPLAAEPLDRLSNTRDRPLFSPTRRPPVPPPVVAAAPSPPPPPPDVALLGVVMDGEEARAVVRTGPAAKIQRVSIGDDIDGWKVGQIEEKKLVLLLDGRTATIMMFTGDFKRSSPNTGAATSPSAGTYQAVAQQHQTTADEPVPASRRRPH